MTISVIIPVFNRPRFVCRAINSVLAQKRPPDEIIVVNDGSTDGTRRALKSYGDKITLIDQANSGVAASRNRGIAHAVSEWVALLDSDDEWLPHKLEKQVKFLLENRHLFIAQCQEIWIRNNKRVNPKRKHYKYGGNIFIKSLAQCIVSPSAVIFKKGLWQELGGFDEVFPVCEDYDFWLRVLRKYPIGLDEEPGILKYGGHGDQLSLKKNLLDKWRVKAIEKHLLDTDLGGEYRCAALQEICLKIEIIINGKKKRALNYGRWQEKYDTYRAELEVLKTKQVGIK